MSARQFLPFRVHSLAQRPELQTLQRGVRFLFRDRPIVHDVYMGTEPWLRPTCESGSWRRPEEEAGDSVLGLRSSGDCGARISIPRAAGRVQQKRAKRTAISEIKRPNAPATRRRLPPRGGGGLSGSPTANKPDTNIPRPALMRRPRQNQSLENTHSWRPWRAAAYVRVNKPTASPEKKFLPPTWPAATSRRAR